MSWMFYFNDLMGNLMEALVIISYFRTVSGNKLKSSRNMILVCSICSIVRTILYFQLNIPYITLSATVVTITAIALVYNTSLIKTLIFVPIMFIMILFSEILVSIVLFSLTGLNSTDGRDNILFFTSGILVSKMVLFALLRLIQFIVPSYGEKVPSYLMVPLLMLPIASSVLIYILGIYNLTEVSTSNAMPATCAVILLAFSNVGLFFLLEYHQREENEKNRMRLVQKQTEGQIAFYRELAERQQISNKTMHDLKNQMFALSEAMKTDSDKTREIMESISGKIFAASPMTVTGIDAVDSLIFTKKQQMELHGIRYEQSVHIAPETSFDPLDLCVLLGNLLDNAIEANEKVDPDKRFVSLTITQQELWLSITITNAAAHAVKVNGKTIRTTKIQKELHGFGLSSVNEIAAKYQGNCTFRSTDHEFTAYLILQDA